MKTVNEKPIIDNFELLSINILQEQRTCNNKSVSLGLSKTASAMSTLGNSFEESVALMVGAGEQMPNQSGKIARGLKIAS